MKNITHYRQGDVLILPVNSIPKGLKKTKKCTLALGEKTGHHHTIFEGAVGYAEDVNSIVDFFEVTKESADLKHQEHDTISLPPGKYQSVIQSEYSPEEIRRVQD